MAKARPVPVLRLGDRAAMDRIAMESPCGDSVELFVALIAVSSVVIVKSTER
jgi:hypothetical protein